MKRREKAKPAGGPHFVWRRAQGRLGCGTALLFSVYVSIAGLQAQPAGDRYQSLVESAEKDVAAGRYGPAQSALGSAVELAPERAEAWTELGLLYDRENDFKSAEAALRRSLRLDPEQSQGHYLLGLTLVANPLEQLDWPAANHEFRETIRLNPKDADAADRLGAGLLATGATDEAIRVLEQAIQLDPKQASAQFDLGLALESKGDLEGAASHLRLALKAKPDSGEAASALGKLLFMQDHVAEAESLLRQALRNNPDLQDAHYALGRVLRKENKVEQARHEFEEAVALDQRTQRRIESLALSNGALAKAGKGDFTGAEDDLRQAVRLRPDYGVPHYNLGLILADRQKMLEAASQLRVAISLLPGRPQPWIDLAKVQNQLGQSIAARQSIAEALRLAPNNENAQKLGKSLQAAATMPAPVGASELEGTLLTDDTLASHSTLAVRLEEESDWIDAAGEWLRVLALQPAAETPRLALSHCFEESGDHAGAILEARKVLLLDAKSVQANLTLGQALLSSGLGTEAREAFQQALFLDPKSAAAKSALLQLSKP